MSKRAALPHIGYLLDRFPAVSETFILREIERLRAEGSRISVAALHRPIEVRPEWQDLVRSTHYRPSPWRLEFWQTAGPNLLRPLFWREAIRAIREGMGHPELRTLRSLLPSAAWAAGLFRNAGVRHVHSHFLGAPALVGRVAARLLGVTFSITVHGSDLRRLDPFYAGNVSAAQFVLTCTAESARLVSSRFAISDEHIHLVYHTLDLERFAPGSPGNTGPPALLFIGRLVPKKGIDALIRACARLRDRGVAFECEILGDGPDRTALENLIRNLALEDRVFMRGACDEVGALAAYRRAALFVLPCRVAADGDQDGLPNVLVEALACGVPVVTTPVGAITELISHGETGRLVPPDDPESLADEIGRLLNRPEERRSLARVGRDRVERQFNRSADPLMKILQEELAGR
ncbi:MAG TPA: glycosyltransferase family 4 protein [Armatimonadota bacterium]|nr:glycosyltransferase family 4 protein [Armatimonadota bacterium]